ncbi:lipopolysaccharide core heptose(II) kinase RfaY [Lentisphaera profundi]|uniref:Lipopolysaccharide core heptose(II) kinase RfaY n=1 Tax=Lentisphaera profundi TaxID=1658616 RepID=A0ABY7VTI1_9BACT|nr:lipopolysaccharide core heptose(II) kinase RfaY [Lentisphaera profundi]WDE96578.1 lipopolysaccharide core heptose(II) kinase RfaY [Lentisphaera profundi]
MEKFFIESLSLDLLEEVRILPGKRYVCRGMKDGEEVYLKFFYGSGSERYFNREEAGLKLLSDNGFLGPKLLDSGEIEGALLPGLWQIKTKVYFVITEKVSGVSLSELWSSTTDKKSLMQRLVSLMSQYHQAGIMQTDLHFGNFMIDDNEIACLDGDGLRKSKSTEKHLENLALLCAQAGFYCPLTIEEILDCYQSAVKKDKFEKIFQEVQKWRIERLLAKVQRNCTAVHVRRKKADTILINKKWDSDELNAFLKNPNKELDEGRAKILKAGNTCTVYQIEIDGREMVIKRYNPRKGLKGKMDVLRAGRSKTCWSHSFVMRDNFLSTPESVALLIRKEGVTRCDWLVTRVASGDLLSDYVSDLAKAENILSEVQSFFDAMKQGRFSHGDCKATNFIVGPDAKLQVIDLDSSIFHKCTTSFEKAYKKDKARFLRNWPDEIKKFFTEKVVF